MSSTFDARFAAQSWPVLKAQFGRSVTHCPRGCDPADGTIVTAVVHLDVLGEQERTDFLGTRRIRTGRLEVDADLDVSAALEHRPRDTFLIDGQLWGVRQVRTRPGGFRGVEIERYPDPVGTPPG